MKPSWDDAPEWARWLSQDNDGRWVWFEYKPRPQESTLSWIQQRIGRWSFADGIAPNYDWTDALERRP